MSGLFAAVTGIKGYAVIAIALAASLAAIFILNAKLDTAQETIKARDAAIATSAEKITGLVFDNKQCTANVDEIRKNWAAYRAAESERAVKTASAIASARQNASAAAAEARRLSLLTPATCAEADAAFNDYLNRRGAR